MKELYLLTGAAGHLGSAVLRLLLKANKSVRVLVLEGEEHLITGSHDIFYGDVCIPESMIDFFTFEPDIKTILIHCAGIVSISSSYVQKVYDVNVTGTQNVLDLALQYNINQFLYVSSVHAIPEGPKGSVIKEIDNFNPDQVLGHYAKTKAAASALVLAASTPDFHVNIVHPSGICGPYDFSKGHITSLVKDYYAGRLRVGMQGGYDFVDVRDVAQGIISCIDNGPSGECYILSNQYFSIKEVLQMLHDLTGKKPITYYLSTRVVGIIAPLAEIYYKLRKQTPLYTSYSSYTLQSNAIFSHTKADYDLFYNTRSFKETLGDTLTWLEQSGQLN